MASAHPGSDSALTNAMLSDLVLADGSHSSRHGLPSRTPAPVDSGGSPPTDWQVDVPSLNPNYSCSLLIVDDDPAIASLLESQLQGEFQVSIVTTAAEARQRLSRQPADILLTDLQLQDESGLQLLDWVQRVAPQMARVLITGTARIEDAADAINCCRVHRFILKPWRSEDLLTAMRSVARNLLVERSHDQLLQKLQLSHQQLETSIQTRTRELEAALLDLKSKNQILEKMALTDPLTGLPNRRAIELIARKELARRIRSGHAVAFGLVDADHFKEVNSRYLLSGGDCALAWLGQVLQRSMRSSDALGRIGGEEFMVVAPDTDRAGGLALAERLRHSVEHSPVTYQQQQISLTVSVGFAVAPAGILVPYEHLREQAAVALAQAKEQGRNCCVVRSCDPTCSSTLHMETVSDSTFID